MARSLTDLGRTGGGSQIDELLEEVRAQHPHADTESIARAYEFARAHHLGQVRQSGDPYISHPLGCARIVVAMGMDETSVIAALLHDTVEDTPATLDDLEREFGSTVATIVDGVTKLSKLHFESKEELQAENYRKLIVSMATDIRVLIVKLADRLHNMRTLSYMAKQKQIQISRETLDVYAPLAHRLGIHHLKWELEDLAFSTLHPRRYGEIQQMVNQRRADRETYVAGAGEYLDAELRGQGIVARITGRPKHFYSIYEKMTRRGKEFNEIYDLTAMRVLVDSVKDCYGAVGIIHSLWKPMPQRFKDYIAVPKPNMYQSLHTTVVGPEGKPLEIQIRTHEMHRTAEYGVAAHWLYKDGADAGGEQMPWLNRMMDWQQDTKDPAMFLESLRQDLYADEVFVFTPKGELRNLPKDSTPVDFAYDVHTDVGHRCVGAKVNGRIVPLTYRLQSGDFVEILTTNKPRGPSNDWLKQVRTSKAKSKIRAFFARERREDHEHKGRDVLQDHLRKAGLPSQKMAGSPLLLEVIKELGFRKADDFYISIGSGKTSAPMVVNKILARLKSGQPMSEDRVADTVRGRKPVLAQASSDMGIEVDGLTDVLVRLAKCCKPVPGDDILGYISLGRGITIHRSDCPNARALLKNPGRFTPVSWVGANQKAFRAEVAVSASDRPRLLEDLSRTFGEHGVNIISAHCSMENEMVDDRFVVDVGDIETLRTVIAALRNVEAVFDAYRVTPG
ncbi:MAG: bifunctional (p)ppGpp synthetase/guanosine-3',5'-bis(diphosphate) 3'-pyrophosphohydrolase [Thermoleophilia bacterium]